MCGIFALFDDTLSPAELEAQCKKLTSLLSHRGPDEVGCHVGAGFALGHARLSIMDPAHGHQPLIHAPTGNALVHNGEIYNHVQLRARAAEEAAASGAPPPVYATHSDSESILPLFETHGSGVAAMLDGMFAFVAVRPDGSLLAARDPCGIKPLYRGWNSGSGRMLFASELKCLVGQVEHAEEFPAGHLWTREGGYTRYFAPEWLRPTFDPTASVPLPTGGPERVRALLKAAVAKRLMSDVGYGLLLSGGLDSAIVCLLMSELTEMRTVKTFTVGMPNSPDIMAARAVARHFGTVHHEYLFTPDEAFAMVPKVVYHLETYEPELIRSSIPNYFLAQLAGAHTKVVLTGEGADELFAGYLYFRDCPDRAAMQAETLRIWGHLHSVNLQRSDRMGMAHGLEARVPFLDTTLLAEAYGHIDPELKMQRGGKAEKHLLRALFEGEIPHDVLWRTKAMQCEGVGTDWVAMLQAKCAAAVSDAEMAAAATTFPINPPQSKEEYYYRALFAKTHAGMDHFVHVWPGGCRAGGAAWQSAVYTRAGLADTQQLRHALMEKEAEAGEGTGPKHGEADKMNRGAAQKNGNGIAAAPPPQNGAAAGQPNGKAIADAAVANGAGNGAGRSEVLAALFAGPSPLPAAFSALPSLPSVAQLLATGGDSRIDLVDGANKYGIPSCPQLKNAVVRSACTSCPPTALGYAAAEAALQRMAEPATGTLDAFAREMADVRSRIGAALRLPAGCEVVLAASGVQAEYLPMVIAQQLHPGRRICSLVAAAGEVGSATAEAARCLSYDSTAPFGAAEQKNQLLAGCAPVEQVCVPARDGQGRQVDTAAAIREHVARGAEAASNGGRPVWVVRQVLGTKTGFSTALPADGGEGGSDGVAAAGNGGGGGGGEVTNEGLPADTLVVVDACQLRVPPAEVRAHLAAGHIVLITGSKLLHGASFAGAALLPAPLAARVAEESAREGALPFPAGLGSHFSRHELPAVFGAWRSQLHASPNLGLLLRWHTALPMLEGLCALPDGAREAAEEAWTKSVCELVEAQPALSVMSAQSGIVSFLCKRARGEGAPYGTAELTRVHRLLQKDLSTLKDPSSGLPLQGSRPCAHRALAAFIGQPVAISEVSARAPPPRAPPPRAPPLACRRPARSASCCPLQAARTPLHHASFPAAAHP